MPFAKNLRVIPLVQWCLSSLSASFGKQRRSRWVSMLIPILMVTSCTSQTPQADTPATEGTLKLVANGEEFVRQGFVSRDQWELSFDHVYITLDQVSAYETSLIYGSQKQDTGRVLEPALTLVDAPITTDLAVGESPVVVANISAPSGHYQGLSWHLIPALSGPAQGASILIQGEAQKAKNTLKFTLKLDPKLEFRCGDFIGAERKGILQPNQTAELEATFHFDHLFGDGTLPPTEEINQEALGFDPLAQLAQAGEVNLDLTQPNPPLSFADVDKLKTLLRTLGHVGEGHCEANAL